MRVLIVEDSTAKYGQILKVLMGQGVLEENVKLAVSAAEALRSIKETRFDLLVLDINLPKRADEEPTRGAGLDIIRNITRDEKIIPPKYIVGITQYEDVYKEFGPDFSENLFSIILYSQTSDQWKSALINKIEYITAVLKSHHFSDGKTYGIDVAIICALEEVEFDAIQRLDVNWQPLNLLHDETRYISGEVVNIRSERLSVIGASASRMGMPEAATLCSKIIHNFRPRLVIMVGICGGRSSKVNLGDIVVADPVWDWGSGKISSVGNRTKFEPAPDQIRLDVDIRSQVKALSSNASAMAEIKKLATGKKPEFELKVHIKPLVSGASVVAHKKTFDSLLIQHRDVHALEMEAYGIAAAARGSGKPRPKFLIAKSVCDYADKDKEDDFQEYSANVSAQFIMRFLLEANLET